MWDEVPHAAVPVCCARGFDASWPGVQLLLLLLLILVLYVQHPSCMQVKVEGVSSTAEAQQTG